MSAGHFSRPCTLRALFRGRSGSRLAALYSASYPLGGWVPLTPEHFLSGLHQAPAPQHTHSHHASSSSPLPGPYPVIPPRSPDLGAEEAPIQCSEELLPAARWRGGQPGRS